MMQTKFVVSCPYCKTKGNAKAGHWVIRCTNQTCERPFRVVNGQVIALAEKQQKEWLQENHIGAD